MIITVLTPIILHASNSVNNYFSSSSQFKSFTLTPGYSSNYNKNNLDTEEMWVPSQRGTQTIFPVLFGWTYLQLPGKRDCVEGAELLHSLPYWCQNVLAETEDWNSCLLLKVSFGWVAGSYGYFGTLYDPHRSRTSCWRVVWRVSWVLGLNGLVAFNLKVLRLISSHIIYCKFLNI